MHSASATKKELASPDDLAWRGRQAVYVPVVLAESGTPATHRYAVVQIRREVEGYCQQGKKRILPFYRNSNPIKWQFNNLHFSSHHIFVKKNKIMNCYQIIKAIEEYWEKHNIINPNKLTLV